MTNNPGVVLRGRRVGFLLPCALVCALLMAGLGVGAEKRDPKAVVVAKRTMNAMGGEGSWDNVKFLRFEFNVRSKGELQRGRTHLWDKWSGRYRYESQTQDGKAQVVLFNVNDKKGEVYIDGERVQGDGVDKILDGAHGAFINDTYWLAMPWKWLDPGVNLEYVGEEQMNGQQCDVVKLSFESVGRTPGDGYLAYASKESGVMIHWSYTLQSDRTGAWDWEYVDAGGIKLAQNHTNEEGREIHMGDVRVFDSVDDSYFTDPGKMLSSLK